MKLCTAQLPMTFSGAKMYAGGKSTSNIMHESFIFMHENEILMHDNEKLMHDNENVMHGIFMSQFFHALNFSYGTPIF